MNILGFEPTQEQIESCLAAMTGRFTAAAIVAVAIEHGVPGSAPGIAAPKSGQADVAMRLVDRLLQAQKRKGLIAFASGAWTAGQVASSPVGVAAPPADQGVRPGQVWLESTRSKDKSERTVLRVDSGAATLTGVPELVVPVATMLGPRARWTLVREPSAQEIAVRALVGQEVVLLRGSHGRLDGMGRERRVRARLDGANAHMIHATLLEDDAYASSPPFKAGESGGWHGLSFVELPA